MKHFSEQICKWYLLNFRKLPWRSTKNPYKIWVSEIILQQTRVNQGLDYYKRFLDTFPTPVDLAKAPEDKVLKVWQGLGYYSRARNMHKTAKLVDKTYGGKFPKQYDQLLKLPGVGPYTAAAVASFANNEPYAVVDGNVLRVLARYFNVEEAVNSTSGKKTIEALAGEILNKKNAATHNQAIMELGALVCTPRPRCEVCPLQESCQALRKGNTQRLPVKNPKTSVRNRYISYYLITDKKSVLLRKRQNKDIWKGLYDFPSLESEQKQLTEKQRTSFVKKLMGKNSFRKNKTTGAMIHLLSHRKLHIDFNVLYVRALPAIAGCKSIKKTDVKKLAFPKPVALFLENHGHILSVTKPK